MGSQEEQVDQVEEEEVGESYPPNCPFLAIVLGQHQAEDVD
jgi:hypothetical protein